MLNLTGGRRIQFSSLRIIPYVRLDRAERAIGWIFVFQLRLSRRLNPDSRKSMDWRPIGLEEP